MTLILQHAYIIDLWLLGNSHVTSVIVNQLKWLMLIFVQAISSDQSAISNAEPEFLEDNVEGWTKKNVLKVAQVN